MERERERERARERERERERECVYESAMKEFIVSSHAIVVHSIQIFIFFSFIH